MLRLRMLRIQLCTCGLLASLPTAVSAANTDEPGTNAAPSLRTQYIDLVAKAKEPRAATFEPYASRAVPAPSNREWEEISGDGSKIIEYADKWYESAAILESSVLDDTQARILFPGSLLWSVPLLKEGTPQQLPRLAGMPEVNVVVSPVRMKSGAEPRFTFNGTFGDYQAKLSDLLRHVENTAAAIKVQRSQSESVEDALQQFGMSASYWGTRLAASLHKGKHRTQSFIAVAVDQNFFNVDRDTQRGADGGVLPMSLIDDPATGEWIVSQMHNLGEVCYVENVSYGRRIIFTIAASCSQEDLNRAFSLSARGTGGKLDTDWSEAAAKVYSTMDVRGVVIGGDYDAAAFTAVLGAREQFLERLNEFLGRTGAFTATTVAVPVRFTSKYASDDQVARKVDVARFLKEIRGREFCNASRVNIPDTSLAVETGPEHSRLIASDWEVHSDDCTGVQVWYSLGIRADGRAIEATLRWEVTERESNCSYRNKTKIESVRTVNLFELQDCPNARILAIEGVPLSGHEDHRYSGEQHGFKPYKDVGGLRSVHVSFDGPGGNDQERQGLRAMFAPITMVIDRERPN